MAEKVILKDREHPLYTEKIGDWIFYRDAAKGGKEFATNNIFTHRLEDSDDLAQREERVYYLNYCDILPDIYNSYIFRETIKRPTDPKLELFRENVDRRGTHISDFIKKAGRYATIYGACHIIVDVPEPGKVQPTVADVKESGDAPFCTIILPTQLKDWSVDDAGRFRWICYEYQYLRDLDPTLEREEETHYKIITTEEWWIEDETGAKVKFDEEGAKSEGTNELKFIPIYTLYNKEGEDDKVGESMLKDIAYINRIVLNWCSLIDEQIERQTFSQLIVPDDASMDEDEQKGKDPLDRISTSVAFTFNPESKHPPAFISPSVDTINTIWNLSLDHVREIFRLAGLQGGSSDLYTSKSGRQSQMSFKSVDSSLADKSLTYQKLENAISKLAYRQLNENIADYENVKYPSSFNTVALSEEVDGLLKVMERNFSETLNKTLMKDIARKAITVTPEAVKEIIENEIDAGDGIVKSDAAMSASLNPDQEKDGDGNPNTNQGKSFKPKEKVDKEESSKRSTD